MKQALNRKRPDRHEKIGEAYVMNDFYCHRNMISSTRFLSLDMGGDNIGLQAQNNLSTI